jgi:hypothetical protein
LYITFSKILGKDANREIGLKFYTFLSPFLYNEVTIEYFNVLGKIPVDNDLLIT